MIHSTCKRGLDTIRSELDIFLSTLVVAKEVRSRSRTAETGSDFLEAPCYLRGVPVAGATRRSSQAQGDQVFYRIFFFFFESHVALSGLHMRYVFETRYAVPSNEAYTSVASVSDSSTHRGSGSC